MRTDDQIKSDIIRQLEWEPALDSSNLQVSVHKGIVSLCGNVHSYYEKITAENAARMIAGVRAIADDVTIGVSPVDGATDAQIAEAIAAALAAHRYIDQRKIQVIVDQGVVTLEGTTYWHFERCAVDEVIRGMKGVRKINNYIVIRPQIPAGDIKQYIENSLYRLATLDADKIFIEVQGNKVILSGTVRTLSEGDDAVNAVWSAPGVASIENRLILEEKEF